MAISVSLGHWSSPLVLICIFLSAWQTGIAQNPQTAAAGVLSNEYNPGSGGGNSNNQYQPGTAGSSGNQAGSFGNQAGSFGNQAGSFGNQAGTGNAYDDPDHIISKALLCFSDKQIYHSCSESYRLSASGDLHVPQEYTEEYCTGPCLSETHFVLDCLGGIMSSFKFYNEATIRDVRETVKDGCSNGPTRGDFNVAEHVQEDNYGNAWKIGNPLFLHGFVLLISALFLLF